MNENLDNYQYSIIHNYRYAEWFKDVQYNGKTLSDEERKEFVTVINETVEHYKEGLPMMSDELERCKDMHDEYHEVSRVLNSVMLFVLTTMIDSMVASKYFILADTDYDRRFMRGKLMVILNEGFKKLYGFDKKTHKKSEWDRLIPILKVFPEQIHYQYQELTYHLEKHATTSSWWKDERNLETHLVKEMADACQKLIVDNNLNKGRTVIVSQTYPLLRALEQQIRISQGSPCMTTFETQEVYDKILGENDGNALSEHFIDTLKDVRDNKKIHFTMDTDLLKLSSIHSYKGWDADNVILIIQPEEAIDDFGDSVIMARPELIYTAITRAKLNLFVLNMGNPVFDDFFRQEVNS